MKKTIKISAVIIGIFLSTNVKAQLASSQPAAPIKRDASATNVIAAPAIQTASSSPVVAEIPQNKKAAQTTTPLNSEQVKMKEPVNSEIKAPAVPKISSQGE